ncbi:DUF5682 family protein [Streptomyces sp. NPDC020983]|uniref:DUF5682 family protein n=1 Tax=Streptomyces sp. NPDC020983 TaxID=3365106 RepID=UPI0037986E6D
MRPPGGAARRPGGGPAAGTPSAGRASGGGRVVATGAQAAGSPARQAVVEAGAAGPPEEAGAGAGGGPGPRGRARDVSAATVLAQGAGDAVLLGVRHHGPGSARAVLAALEAYRPQAVLIEGPPEADTLVALAADPAMRPPVALLSHVADDPARAAFWPFAEFSPEWVALRWAAAAGAEVRFIDLPAAVSLALRPSPEEQALAEGPGGADGEAADGPGPAADVRIDPLAVLAETAGYDDPERWWEDAVEHRGDGTGGDGGAGDGGEADPLAPFAALGEAMAAIRAVHGDGGHPHDPVREAHMRLRLREARRAHARTAVVCGAWHVPALAARTAVAADRQLVKGLPRARVETTWVPWTHRRLARASGYGAGIDSPGWYRHLFTAPDRPVARWMTKVAGLLRAEDIPVSSAHVIEAVRLAETLAALRGRPLAGLGEATDAVRAVMCEGSDVPLALVRDRLVVGDALGEVPPDAPAVPLARDLARQQRTLRLKPEALERHLELDLRKDTDAARSRLLHRLALLAIGWGEPAGRRGSTGTFREEWRLRWEPELAVRVAEAGIWGTTVASAAAAKAADAAAHAGTLAEVTALAEACLLAGLAEALPVVMRVLADRAALDTDVAHLAEALPALVRAVRYGDVRGTDAASLGEVAAGLALRICVGLPPACTGLDGDGAAAMREHLDGVHRAVALLPDPELRERWAAALRGLAERGDRPGGAPGGIPGLLRGAAARLLLDDGRLTAEQAARLMGLTLSPGTAPAEAAGWIEGFLAGGGMLLVHDERLLALLDAWICAVPPAAFTDVLPLLRRTFAEFEPGVRRTVGELVRRGPATARRPAPGSAEPGLPGFGPVLDATRASAAAHTVRLLLGTTTTTDLGTHPTGGA